MANLFKETILSADYISTLTNKSFKIVKSPRYEMVKSLDNPDEEREKLILTINLLGEDNPRDLDYYPNKTSQKVLARNFGYDMDNWVGKVGEMEVLKQKVRGENRNVIYIKN